MALFKCNIITEQGDYEVKTKASTSSHAKLNAIKYVETIEQDSSPIIKASAQQMLLPVDYKKCFFLKSTNIIYLDELTLYSK